MMMRHSANHCAGRAPRRRFSRARSGGVGALLAMMYLVIFASLAAAMAIVAQGNLSTADSFMKVNQTLAAAETGLKIIEHQLDTACAATTTRNGEITATTATTLWPLVAATMRTNMSGAVHNLAEPRIVNSQLAIGPIVIGPGAPTFTATLTPHPIPGEDYNSAYYRRPPYSTMTPAVSSSAPLDARWIRVRVEASAGQSADPITRAVQVDFLMDKKIPYAILSRSRVMIGKNVSVTGDIGSRFMDTNLANGHPVQMESDFKGLNSTLDAALDGFKAILKTNDRNGDNRIDLSNPDETAGITNPAALDRNGDGFIDDYDYFVASYDANADGIVSASELNTGSNVRTAELLKLIDTSGDPNRPGYNDGKIDNNDLYAKIHGTVKVRADMASWNSGAAGGSYLDYFAGAIMPDYGQTPLQFESTDSSVYSFSASDFDTASLKARATGDLAAQAASQATTSNPLGTTVREEVPYGSPHPYDYYNRPVYQNMTFTNVKIPKGSNALFKNCRFVGCTFVETETNNTDPNFNFAGIQQVDGTLRYADKAAVVNGATVADTRTVANNVRFDSCTFEGAVVTDPTTNYTHVRNKLAFTGQTQWNVDGSTSLTTAEKTLYKRSTLLAPNYSVELGTFVNPTSTTESVTLNGAIVAGIIDMRGQVTVNGSIITTFEPVSNSGPVVGNTSPNFNTTLGYFAATSGDGEGELPSAGMGVVRIRYDKSVPLPDGILGPIQIKSVLTTYFEVGAVGN
jgi:hypothetical protein